MRWTLLSFNKRPSFQPIFWIPSYSHLLKYNSLLMLLSPILPWAIDPPSVLTDFRLTMQLHWHCLSQCYEQPPRCQTQRAPHCHQLRPPLSTILHGWTSPWVWNLFFFFLLEFHDNTASWLISLVSRSLLPIFLVSVSFKEIKKRGCSLG